MCYGRQYLVIMELIADHIVSLESMAAAGLSNLNHGVEIDEVRGRVSVKSSLSVTSRDSRFILIHTDTQYEARLF